MTPNVEECLCGLEKCSTGGFYCDPTRQSQQCHKKFCSDYDDIDALCDQKRLDENNNTIFYGNGVADFTSQCNNEKCTCAKTHCEGSDFERCCKPCEGNDVGVANGKCSKRCWTDQTICQGDHVDPPTPFTPELKKELNPLYTGFCNGLSCSPNDVETCCVPAPKCQEQQADVLCQSQQYSGVLLNKNCLSFQCQANNCCEQITCNCTGGEPAIGWDCPKAGDLKCISCYGDRWLNGFDCIEATKCNFDEQYEFKPLQTISDRICLTLTTCKTNEFEKIQATQTSDRTCQSLTTCNNTQYEYTAPDKTTDRVCKAITLCNENQYQVQPPDETHDRVCNTLTSCTKNQYQLHAPNTTHDRICKNISKKCNFQTEYQSQPPDETHDRICKPITTCNTTSHFIKEKHTNISDTDCVRRSICSSSEYIESDGNETTDRSCKRLKRCRNVEYEDTPMQIYTRDRICKLLTVCKQDEYNIAKETKTSDRICKKCDFDECFGCTLQSDCDYNTKSKILNISTCSRKTCNKITYQSNQTSIAFNPINPKLKYGEWYRFENKSTETITLKGLQAVQRQHYQYIFIPEDHEGDVSYEIHSIKENFDLHQDCQYNIVCSVCSVPCGPGNQLCVRREKIKDAKNGGLPCSSIPKLKSQYCEGQMCPQNCTVQWNTAFDPCLAKCGKTGIQYKNYTIIHPPKFGGTPCPSILPKRGCKGTPKHPFCDCEGRKYDICNKCGGDGKSCLGCDGIPNSGKVIDSCGICGGHNKCVNKLRRQKEDKKNRSSLFKYALPVGAGIILSVIFVSIISSFCSATTTLRTPRTTFLTANPTKNIQKLTKRQKINF